MLAKFPNYRKLTGEPKAVYREMNNGQKMILPIDFTKFNELVGVNFSQRNITSSIIEIESLLDKVNKGNGEICLTFSEDQHRLLWENSNASYDNGWRLEKAWWAFPTNHFANIYSRTQDILIDFLIAINKDFPDLEKQLDFMNEPESSKTAYNTHIHGNVVGSNVGIGEGMSQHDITINYNAEVKELVDKIIELGFKKVDIKELEEILIEKKKSGTNVSKQLINWIGKMATKAIEIGIEHKIPELTQMLSNYL